MRTFRRRSGTRRSISMAGTSSASPPASQLSRDDALESAADPLQNRRQVHSFSREALYELVWSESTRTLAARFGISDVGLAKACKGANIPTPDRGYWARVAAGQECQRTPLPPDHSSGLVKF